MLMLGARVAAAALIIVFACVFLWPLNGLAADCAGRMVRASWYGTESGNRTANGEYFDGTSLTAAMPSRSHLGERYRVTYRGKSVTVRVNDIGPAAYLRRDIDLSRAAAKTIGMIEAGVAMVCLERL